MPRSNRAPGFRFLLATLLCAGLFIPAHAARAGDGEAGTVEEIVAILKDKGLIDDAQQEELLARNAREQARSAPSVGAQIMEGVVWSGDLRLRHETFWFDSSPNGLSTPGDRSRMRYRARLGFTKPVNDWAKVGFRLASGTFENDSTNRTLGNESAGVAGVDDDFDFANDSIFIDRAWGEFKLPTGELQTTFFAGKVANPFLWKHGKDILIWDGDINPEGAYLTTSMELGGGASLFATAGAFDVDENSSSADGMLYAGQLGSELSLGGGMSLGVRGSYYQWQNLDADNLARAVADGNTSAQTFNVDSKGRGDAKIGEISAYLKLAGNDDWPMAFYGTFAQNFDAQSLGGVDDEDQAYGLGFEVGDKRKLVSLGAGWFYIEANALVATFIDSDLFDAKTNRKGFVLYGSRQLGEHVDLNVTYFDSDEIDSGFGFGANSLVGADRKRLQTDVVLKF